MRSFQKLTMLLAIVAASSLLLATGCGGCDDDDDVDAYVPPDYDAGVDAQTFDAAPPDAAPMSTHTGQLTIADIQLLTDEAPYYGAEYGHGIKKFFSFYPYIDAETDPNIIYDDRDSLGAGCVAWVYDLENGDETPVRQNHGTLTINGTTNPFPSTGCMYLDAIHDYYCPGASGDADHVMITSVTNPNPPYGQAGLFAFIDADGAFTATDAGKYLSITAANGMDNYPWNGAFPIIAYVDATTVLIGSAEPAAQVDAYVTGAPGIGVDPDGAGSATAPNPLNAASVYVVLAGEGPVPPGGGPGGGSPLGIQDDDEVTVSLDAPDGDAFEDFTTNTIDPGDTFTLAPASIATFVAVPTDGSAFSLECNSDVASYTGDAAAFTKNGDNMTITTDSTTAFVGVRDGAEVTISGSTTGGNNGTYTIASHSDNTITYPNAAGAEEDFAAGTGYAINDCGSATLTGVSMDFNNGLTYDTLYTYTGDAGDFVVLAGAGPGGSDVLQINVDGADLSPGYFGLIAVVMNATTTENNGNYSPIIGAANGYIRVIANASAAAEDFAATTTIMVLKPISGLPDEATATMAGSISCASLSGTKIDVPADASDAINQVDPSVIQSTFIRSALDIKTNADGTNRTNVLVGHGFASFTVPD